MSSAFFLFEDIDFSVEFSVWCQATWLDHNLTALDLLALDTAEEKTGVVACLTLVEILFEGLDAGYYRLLSCLETNNFNCIVDLDDTLLDTASGNCTTTLDREDVFDRHQEWLVKIALWLVDVIIDRFDEFHNCVF